ncbi:MAG: hypothetical protein AVDCRST_MAG71-2493 [uncultured Lysobacter sp.]|uniref:Uncharacterized protein n=1 Tax=uncultured Lysobacter sp. TaxID=271060 RepID=A0A6J4LZE0_9GAMM|nr:MAG: hypothetical protein AVDCRST_MAG71-2493 [uncultured Lysobacter sp.]
MECWNACAPRAAAGFSPLSRKRLTRCNNTRHLSTCVIYGA